ncbi:MAG: DUF2249 domain-containing protein, partial [Flavobacteriales bacterium]
AHWRGAHRKPKKLAQDPPDRHVRCMNPSHHFSRLEPTHRVEPFSPSHQGAFMSQAHLHLSPDAIYPFDARGVAKRFRHAAIFGALDSLQPGETMRFANDHDPLPLLAQIAQRYGDRVSVEYRQRDPGMIVIDFSVL